MNDDNGHLDHHCWYSGCTAFASYGRGVDLRHNRKGEWSCSDHLWPDFFAAPAPPTFTAGPTIPPSGAMSQGRLL